MELYHGTSSMLGELKKITPSEILKNQTEISNRTILENFVYLTNSILSAFRYAEKICRLFGGEPVVYLCIPDEEPLSQHDTEFVCTSATVSRVLYPIK